MHALHMRSEFAFSHMQFAFLARQDSLSATIRRGTQSTGRGSSSFRHDFTHQCKQETSKVDLLQHLRMPQPPHFLFNTHLRVLRINHCGLSELSAHSLLPLPNLEVLNLANNNLVTLPTTVLRSLKRLRIVNLSNNKITDLSKLSWVLAEGMTLEQLDLSGNPLALSNR